MHEKEETIYLHVKHFVNNEFSKKEYTKNKINLAGKKDRTDGLRLMIRFTIQFSRDNVWDMRITSFFDYGC